MKNIWINISEDNNLIIDKEKIETKATLLKVFSESLNTKKSRFQKWIETKTAPYECLIELEGNPIHIILFLKAISNAGWEDKPDIKRVQVTNPKLKDVSLIRRQKKDQINLIIGYYNYAKPIFVAWDFFEYTNHATNRSCYVTTTDLLLGYKLGYTSIHSSGQPITIFKPDFMIQYISEYVDRLDKKNTPSLSDINNSGIALAHALKEFNKLFDYQWSGIDAVLEMQAEQSKNWKQMEWPGFYLEHQIETKIKHIIDLFSVKYKNTVFDSFDKIPWDFKVHSINTKSKTKVITNDLEAIEYVLEEFGYIGFIIVEGDAIWDQDGSFKEWHEHLKGSKSKYNLKIEQKARKSRMRKKAFHLKKIRVLIFNAQDIKDHPRFQTGMVNSNQKLRRPKLMIDYKRLKKSNIILDLEI